MSCFSFQITLTVFTEKVQLIAAAQATIITFWLRPTEKNGLPFELQSVSCLYTCFKYLINSTDKQALEGEIATKLPNSVLFNKTNKYDKTTPSAIKKG